jgi:EAL domain-containing protein (putative c-di-GMP-specific phosphodiesterase class I)
MPLPESRYRALSCAQCRSGAGLDFDFSFAFQPVVDVEAGVITAYEALVRGPTGEGAGSVLAQVDEDNRYSFDQACRVRAIALAAELGCQTRLNINFMPNAIYRPELCIRATLEAAERFSFPIDRLTFEFVEGEDIADKKHLSNIVRSYRALGLRTALDDFGAGYSGLNLLAEVPTDYLKLDRLLLQDIHASPTRQAIIEGMTLICHRLNISLVAEGVESEAEYRWLYNAGIRLFQGYYFARPGFEQLPQVAEEKLRAPAD